MTTHVVLLICAITLQPDACTENTATDIVSMRIEDVGCPLMTQAVVAATQLLDDQHYLKVECKELQR